MFPCLEHVEEQKCNQKPEIEGQTIIWPNKKRQKEKQWCTKQYTENKRLINTNTSKMRE